MRTLGLIVVAGLLIALLAATVLGLSVRQIGAGYLAGAAWMVVVSIIMNTANGRAGDPSEYGEELAWMGAGSMDGFELHGPDMRRDRVRRHPEASATFPSGDVA